MWPRPAVLPDPQSVLEAAVQVAFDLGLRAVSHRSVAARLDASPRVVAAVSRPEDELIAEVFTRIVAGELADIRRRVLGNASPVAQMTEVLQQFSEPVQAEADGVWLEAWSLGRTNEHLAAQVRAEEDRWHEFVASIIRRGVRSGDFLATDPETVAAQLLAMMDGVNSYALIGYRSHADRMTMLTSFARAELGMVWEAASVA